MGHFNSDCLLAPPPLQGGSSVGVRDLVRWLGEGGFRNNCSAGGDTAGDCWEGGIFYLITFPSVNLESWN